MEQSAEHHDVTIAKLQATIALMKLIRPPKHDYYPEAKTRCLEDFAEVYQQVSQAVSAATVVQND